MIFEITASIDSRFILYVKFPLKKSICILLHTEFSLKKVYLHTP